MIDRDHDTVCKRYRGTESEVRSAVRAMREHLLHSGCNTIDTTTAEIVVVEILNNVVEHALADQPEGWFRLTYRANKHRLLFHVEDNGCEMPLGHLPEGVPPRIPSSRRKLPEGGWGWSLIRTLADQLTYQRINHINHVSFSIPIHARHDTIGKRKTSP
jgi:serine/threonine-protein kinase RsbW